MAKDQTTDTGDTTAAAEGSNSRLSLQDVRDIIGDVQNLKKERKELTAEIQAKRERINAGGIHKKAFDMAMAYMLMEPEQREDFDVAYAFVRKAGNMPIQPDLFTLADKRAKEAEAVDK